MRTEATYRGIAREVLKNKWHDALLAGLVATMLGASEGGSFRMDIKLPPAMPLVLLLFTLLFSAAFFVVSRVVCAGYARYHLNLADKKEVALNMLFSYFSYWKELALAGLLKLVYIVLSFCLLIIPGIIAIYSYAMTKYILAENPELPAQEALLQSKQMMEGNRWRLFRLHFSFIGWVLLAALSGGVLFLWINPYMRAAETVFYREISGTETVLYDIERE